jgi:hypothetical protein
MRLQWKQKNMIATILSQSVKYPEHTRDLRESAPEHGVSVQYLQ